MLIKNALVVTMDKCRKLIKNGDILFDEKEAIEKAELAKEDLLRRK
jgi:hypothetical protein